LQNLSKIYLKRLVDWTSAEKINEALADLWQKMSEEAPQIKKDEFMAIKLSFGEEETSGYIKSEWLASLLKLLKEKTENLFFVETNTLYREKRSNSVGHLYVASAHGYDIKTTGIPVIIADGLKGREGQYVPIRGIHFENVKIAKTFCEIDSMVCLSHVTGHMQSGFAGALKNLGMGCASRAGKLLQHSRTLPEISIEKCTGCGACMKICPSNAIGLKKKKGILVKERCIGCGECTVACEAGAIEIKYDENVVKFQEKMVEYALGAKKAIGPKITYINFLYNMTKNCDCMSKNEPSMTPDIGLIGGFNPVIVDKASMDIIGVDVFEQAHPGIDPMVQILHAEKINLGATQYELTEV